MHYNPTLDICTHSMKECLGICSFGLKTLLMCMIITLFLWFTDKTFLSSFLNLCTGFFIIGNTIKPLSSLGIKQISTCFKPMGPWSMTTHEYLIMFPKNLWNYWTYVVRFIFAGDQVKHPSALFPYRNTFYTL